MPASQTDDLLRYFGRRLKAAVASGVQQKDIAEAVDVSPAQISHLINGKRAGMRLSNAEALAAYFRLTLVDALQTAIGIAGGASAEQDLRERALRRLDGLISHEATDIVRRIVAEPGRARTEFEWLTIAVHQENARRERQEMTVTDDTAEALDSVRRATMPPPARPASESAPAPAPAKKPRRPLRRD